jgi:hypothetical protein
VGLAVLILSSAHSCCRISVLGLDLEIPGQLVGETQEEQETIPLGNVDRASVEIDFGAGELIVRAGAPGDLLSGTFLYNVAGWAPEIGREDDLLVIEQVKTVAGWSTLTGAARNEWELELSPSVALDLNVAVGAGESDLDLTGLQLQSLELNLGAGDMAVRFGAPNTGVMTRFVLEAGASDTDVAGIGNASPAEMVVRGGLGRMNLDLRGGWAQSADVTISAGVGALTLLLPQDIGVRVAAQGGLSDISASGLEARDGVYLNEAYGTADRVLDISVTTGLGAVRLIALGDSE